MAQKHFLCTERDTRRKEQLSYLVVRSFYCSLCDEHRASVRLCETRIDGTSYLANETHGFCNQTCRLCSAVVRAVRLFADLVPYMLGQLLQ